MDIAEIKYDAIAELSGGDGSKSPSPSSSDAAAEAGGSKPRKEVPRNPQTQPDNVCFYRVSTEFTIPSCREVFWIISNVKVVAWPIR